MAPRRFELRELAADDIAQATDHYLAEGGESLALRFVAAVERAVVRIGRSPYIGSLRFSCELETPELRGSSLGRLPDMSCHVVGDDHAEVWRMLQSRRDVPTTLTDDTR